MPAEGETEKTVVRKKYTPSKEMSYRQAVTSLAIGDVLVFLVFVIIGDTSHEKLNGLASIPHIILVALPFIVGWFIVSPFMGLFQRGIFTQPREMAIRTAIAWIPAWVIAMLLRGIFFDHGIPGSAFMVIALLFNLALLEIWRWPFAINNAARKRGA
ncbi:MAG TPA: DUF3054 domain-containing protein [Ktedonobacteraceae bacterium]|nr:DUF3054 domain-containing protein [Ktedonobacteraceae bacterium]